MSRSKNQPGGTCENHFQLTSNGIPARRLHQQQQSAAPAEDDGGCAAKFRRDGCLPGWHQATVQLSAVWLCRVALMRALHCSLRPERHGWRQGLLPL